MRYEVKTQAGDHKYGSRPSLEEARELGQQLIAQGRVRQCAIYQGQNLIEIVELTAKPAKKRAAKK